MTVFYKVFYYETLRGFCYVQKGTRAGFFAGYVKKFLLGAIDGSNARFY